MKLYQTRYTHRITGVEVAGKWQRTPKEAVANSGIVGEGYMLRHPNYAFATIDKDVSFIQWLRRSTTRSDIG